MYARTRTRDLLWGRKACLLLCGIATPIPVRPVYLWSQVGTSDSKYLVATDRIPELCRALQQGGRVSGGGEGGSASPPHTVLLSCTGADLAGCVFQHPTHDRPSPILCGNHVTNDSGTG